MQCTNEEGYACCLLPSGRYCRPLSLWEGRETPQGWQAGQGSTEAADSESPSDGEQDGSESSSQGSGEGGSSVDGSGGSWRRAAATYFNSYPACCSDDGADQTECHEFSGCQWAGMVRPPARQCRHLLLHGSGSAAACRQLSPTAPRLSPCTRPPAPAVQGRARQAAGLLGAGAQHRGAVRGGPPGRERVHERWRVWTGWVRCAARGGGASLPSQLASSAARLQT